jgi:glutaredoxin
MSRAAFAGLLRIGVLAPLLGLACDLPAVPAAGGADASPTQAELAERPEGWESLEDEGSAMRLYYQFVDERGRVRFVERLEEVPERSRAGVGFVKLDVPPPLTPGDAARARETQVARAAAGSQRASYSAAAATPTAILYSADWCGACRKAKRYLTRRGVAYEERDVDDPAIAAELLRKTGSRSIPVIDVGGRVLTGFSAGSYDALIESA